MVERALNIFDSVTLAIAQNSSKASVFSIAERLEMVQEVFKGNPNVSVESFEGLLVDYVSRKSGHTVIRGIRTNADFEYELALAQANKHLNQDVETIFMTTDPRFSYLSSSMIREIVSLGGSPKGMLPDFIEKRLAEVLKGKRK